jgi:CRP-like cAMP-binding protein
MTKELYRAHERLILARLEIDLIKTIHKGTLGKRFHKTIAGEVELLLIAAAVLIGHVQDTPRNSTDIARQLGIPRATVQRKLGALVKRGTIRVQGRRYLMTDRKPGDDHSYIDLALSLIRNAATKSISSVK